MLYMVMNVCALAGGAVFVLYCCLKAASDADKFMDIIQKKKNGEK